jgi:hypothetical protein
MTDPSFGANESKRTIKMQRPPANNIQQIITLVWPLLLLLRSACFIFLVNSLCRAMSIEDANLVLSGLHAMLLDWGYRLSIT